MLDETDTGRADAFWTALGKKLTVIDGPGDEVFDKEMESAVVLYKLMENGSFESTASGKALSIKMLSNEEVVVLDSWEDVYVWIGRASNDECRDAAQVFAKVRQSCATLLAI